MRAGAEPRFKVTVVVPRDTCTHALQGKCVEFDNGSASATYRVGSSG
ncbi:hypothetical protein JCM10369A_20110 [Nocardioides pyridinolyticus]